MIDYIFGGIVDIHNSPPSFKLKQYDNNSHKLHMTIVDKDNPYGNTVNLEGHSVRAYFVLPDGSDEYVDCELIKPKSGRIAVHFPSSVTQQIGIVKCEIRISDGNDLISLNVFTFEIVESIYNSSAMESTEKYSALDNALNTVQRLSNELDSLIATQEEFMSLFDRSYNVASGSGETGGDTPVVITAPSAPANVTATAGDSSIAISWSAVAGAEYYAVERTTNGGASWTTIAPNITGTNYTDSTAVVGTSYRYAVTAHKTFGSGVLSSGRGALSETVSIQQVPVVETPPAAPANVTAYWNASEGKVYVSWAAVSGVSCTLERKAGSGAWESLNLTSANSYTDSSVTAGTTYQYRVTAHKGSLSSDPATVSMTVPNSGGEPETAPAAPASITATAGSGSIAVTWAESSGAAYYTLERKAGSGTWSAIAQNYTGRSYTDSSVTAGTEYQYRVTAHKNGTSGVLSSSATTSGTVTAQADTPSGNVTLDAPASVTATAGSGQISVTWGAVSGASRYQLERSADNGATWTTLLLYQTANSYTDTTVASGTSYKYRVTAFSSSGDTSPAAVSSSTTPQAAPAAVIGGTAITKAEPAATVVNNITVGWNLGNTLDCLTDPVQLRVDWYEKNPKNKVYAVGTRSIGTEIEGQTYETSWGDSPVVTQEMLKAIVDEGFNAIRIPVSWSHHLRDAALPYDWGLDVIDVPDGDHYQYSTLIGVYPHLSGTVIISPFFLKRVKEVVNMALNAGFKYVILNTHHDAGIYNGVSSRTIDYPLHITGLPWRTANPYQLFHSSNAVNDRLENAGITVEQDFKNMCGYMYQLWTMIAKEFKDYDYRLIFEGFNEVLNWWFGSNGQRDWAQTYDVSHKASDTQLQRLNAFNNVFIKAVRNAGGEYNRNRVLSCETFGATTTDFIIEPFSLSNVPDDGTFTNSNYRLTANEIAVENSRVILQVHYYNDAPSNFKTAAQRSAAAGFPVIFGEAGWHINSGAPPDLYNFGYNLVQEAKSEGAKVFWWDNNKTGTGQDCYGMLNRWNTKNGIPAWDKEALKNGLIAGSKAT